MPSVVLPNFTVSKKIFALLCGVALFFAAAVIVGRGNVAILLRLSAEVICGFCNLVACVIVVVDVGSWVIVCGAFCCLCAVSICFVGNAVLVVDGCSLLLAGEMVTVTFVDVL